MEFSKAFLARFVLLFPIAVCLALLIFDGEVVHRVFFVAALVLFGLVHESLTVQALDSLKKNAASATPFSGGRARTYVTARELRERIRPVRPVAGSPELAVLRRARAEARAEGEQN